MKLIILFLISFTAMAQTKVTIIADAPRTDVMHFEQPDLEKAKKHLKKIVRKSQWLKGEWGIIELGSIYSREKMKQNPTIIEEVLEFVGADVDYEYFKPSNFSIEYKDVTVDREQEISEKQIEKEEKNQIRKMKNDINSSDLPNWHKRILKMYIKGLKDE